MRKSSQGKCCSICPVISLVVFCSAWVKQRSSFTSLCACKLFRSSSQAVICSVLKRLQGYARHNPTHPCPKGLCQTHTLEGGIYVFDVKICAGQFTQFVG